MPNEYYSPSGWPVTGSSGESSPARSEMSAIQAAFDKLPILAGSALRIVRVNPSSTALESITLATADIATLTQVAAAIAAIPTPIPPNLTPYALLSGALFNGSVSYRGGGSVASNVAFGEGGVLTANTTGNMNSAFGYSSLFSNTAGISNSAFGHYSLFSNTTGISNNAFGSYSLFSNTTGISNNAFGEGALFYLTIGFNNCAFGTASGASLTTGTNNTLIGTYSGMNLTTGTNNTLIGTNSGRNLTTGTNNTLIGNSTGTEPAFINVTTHNNLICVGNNSSTNAFIKVPWTVISDARDKTDFSPIPHGLDFVSKLSPTAYRLIESRDNPFPTKDAPLRYGFLAQDILALEGDSPVVVNPSDPERLKMTGDYLIPILVNAIKELKADFDAYKLAHP